MNGHSKRPILAALIAFATVLVTGCSILEQPPPETDQTLLPVFSQPTIDDTFSLVDGRAFALRCWGEGSPTIVYDADVATSGIGAADTSLVGPALAAQSTFCTFDRYGIGGSAVPLVPTVPLPAVLTARTVDNLVDDLHELLLAAGVIGPYLMIGEAGGGFNAYRHAGKYPASVAGLVMLDVPAPRETVPADEFLPWNDISNLEKVDYPLLERTMALKPLPIPPIPVTVITARDGASADANEQLVWLEGSSNGIQTVIDGGRDLIGGPPGEIAEAVRVMLEEIRLTMPTETPTPTTTTAP